MKERAGYIYTNKKLLDDLREIYKKLGRVPMRREIDGKWIHACASTWVYYSRFGSLREAFKKAGLKPTRFTRREALQ